MCQKDFQVGLKYGADMRLTGTDGDHTEKCQPAGPGNALCMRRSSATHRCRNTFTWMSLSDNI
ncbi:hypothetical protein DL98DRAFT_202050 [Cadophora sp. DSE1049]|nr:hypothetical protein DL98DRAFT_202050 [Cadophora sp. DSE1049]